MTAPRIFIDRQRRCYLEIEELGQCLRVIPLNPGGLSVRRLDLAQQRALKLRVLERTPAQTRAAVNAWKRIGRARGATPMAARALRIRAPRLTNKKA